MTGQPRYRELARRYGPVVAQAGTCGADWPLLAVAETGGVQVTAAVLHGAVSILPPGRFDADEAVAQVRAYLAGHLGGQPRHDASAMETFTAQAEKMLRTLQRAASRGTLQAAAHADPEAVRRMIADMRSILDVIEQDAF